MKAAIYAGTFDPITLGHLDLVERATKLFDRLVIAVAVHSRKTVLFEVDERMAMVRKMSKKFPNVEVESFDGLLVNYAHKKGIHVVVRGIRAFSDFEFEFQMALTNRKMAPDIETIFLMPNENYSYVSSSTVREVAQMGGDTSNFVAKPVQQALAAKLGKNRGEKK
jgi:pantetheine-phosphate adenylyltransferase